MRFSFFSKNNSKPNDPFKKLATSLKDLNLVIEGKINNYVIIRNSSTDFLEKFLSVFEENCAGISFHDDKYPSSSDPGASFSYLYFCDQSKWKMTLGNHGWTGSGIYTINRDIILKQIQSLIITNGDLDILVKDIGFFSHDPEASDLQNNEMNKKLLQIHS